MAGDIEKSVGRPDAETALGNGKVTGATTTPAAPAASTVAPAAKQESFLSYVFTPEFMRPADPSAGAHDAKRRSTAYLDGMRGVAAFLVYLGHHVLSAHGPDNRNIEYAFGYKGEYRLINLPFLRTFFSGGHFSVAIFFVISGFVLVRRPIQLIHAGEYEAASKSVGSGMFRRGVRLYVPVLGVSFIYLSSWHLLGVRVSWPEKAPNYFAELGNFVHEFITWSFVLRERGFPIFAYNFPAWSLPVEYQGSIVTYTTLLALARVKTRARLVVMLVLAFYFLRMGSWSSFCFLCGTTLAEVDILFQKDSPALPAAVKAVFRSASFWTAMLVVGLFLGGQPHTSDGIEPMDDSPVWGTLAYWIPAIYREGEYNVYWLAWAGVLVVTSVVFTPWTHAIFDRPLPQYLGRISFAFYLSHGPILWTLGSRFYALVGIHQSLDAELVPWNNRFPLPLWGPYGMELPFWACQAFLLPFSIYWAEVTMRLIDEPSVTLAQKLFKRAQQ